MNAQFEINGLKFNMQGDGFTYCGQDFDRIVENTIAALKSLSGEELTYLHAGSVWVSNEEFDGHVNIDAADALYRIMLKAAEPVLKNYLSRGSIILWISAEI